MNSTLEFLYSLRNQGSKFGIERMALLCRELGNPQHSFPSIHVAGTNGKGSVCTMLDSIYRANDYRVGLFTSPHLVELGERIRVNGKNLPFSQIEEWTEKLRPIIQKLEKTEDGRGPTFFELITAMAFLEFQRQKVDLAIIETGLGGRLDSTNVINPELSIITTVGFDHCEILGNTLSEIASEKAGIIKERRPVVVGWLEKEAREEVFRVASQKNAEVHDMEGTKDIHLPITNLTGSYQRKNAALAQLAVEILDRKFPVAGTKVSHALQAVEFPGRWQTISSHPLIIVDACHNGQGARASEELWDQLPDGFQVWFGACGEDRAREVLPPLLERTKYITLFEIDQPRACTHQDLQKISENFTGTVKFAHEQEIPKLCKKLDPKSTVLVTGSIYLVAAMLSRMKDSGNFPVSRNWQDYW